MESSTRLFLPKILVGINKKGDSSTVSLSSIGYIV